MRKAAPPVTLPTTSRRPIWPVYKFSERPPLQVGTVDAPRVRAECGIAGRERRVLSLFVGRVVVTADPDVSEIADRSTF